MDHAANQSREDLHPDNIKRNSRYGLILFAVYLVIYSAYVLTTAFAPQVMERTANGVTWAIWSGFGLIIAAFLLALVYGWLCRLSTESPQRTRRNDL